MINELSRFMNELAEKYGDKVMVTEVTITDFASRRISHIGPRPGESLDVHMGKQIVKLKNGGTPDIEGGRPKIGDDHGF